MPLPSATTPPIPPISGQRVAIVFFGITRSLRLTIGSIRRALIEPTRALAADIHLVGHFFDQTWIANPRSQEIGPLDPSEVRLLNLDALEQEPPEECLDQFPMDRLMADGDYWQDGFASLRNMLHQLHSLRRATELALAWSPQLVIFARPDLHYHDPVDEWLVRLAAAPGDRIMLPDWAQWRGYNDRFALARGSTCIRAYGTRALQVADRAGQGRPLHAETFLHSALTGQQVDLMPMRASRVRSNGTVVLEDFSPGRGKGGALQTVPFADFERQVVRGGFMNAGYA